MSSKKHKDAPFKVRIPQTELSIEEIRVIAKQFNLTKDKHKFVKLISTDQNKNTSYMYEIVAVDQDISDVVAEKAINMAASSRKSVSSAKNSIVSRGKNLKTTEPLSKGQSFTLKNVKIEATPAKVSSIVEKVKQKNKIVQHKKSIPSRAEHKFNNESA